MVNRLPASCEWVALRTAKPPWSAANTAKIVNAAASTSRLLTKGFDYSVSEVVGRRTRATQWCGVAACAERKLADVVSGTGFMQAPARVARF